MICIMANDKWLVFKWNKRLDILQKVGMLRLLQLNKPNFIPLDMNDSNE